MAGASSQTQPSSGPEGFLWNSVWVWVLVPGAVVPSSPEGREVCSFLPFRPRDWRALDGSGLAHAQSLVCGRPLTEGSMHVVLLSPLSLLPPFSAESLGTANGWGCRDLPCTGSTAADGCWPGNVSGQRASQQVLQVACGGVWV